MRNKQMVTNTCKIFQNFSDPYLQNDPLFSISRIRATHWKKTLGTSVVYVLVLENRWSHRCPTLSTNRVLTA